MAPLSPFRRTVFLTAGQVRCRRNLDDDTWSPAEGNFRVDGMSGDGTAISMAHVLGGRDVPHPNGKQASRDQGLVQG
jgi:hypothetical protein